MIAQARLTQLATSGSDPNLKAIAEEMERLSSGLRDTTMGIRMVPIGTLFGRFRRPPIRVCSTQPDRPRWACRRPRTPRTPASWCCGSGPAGAS